jgi:hypothetical protein
VAVTMTPEDLAPFANIDDDKALAMIADALALAARVAPCINSEDFAHVTAAKAIIRGAILRWNDTGTGALTQQGAGPFQVSIDTRQVRRGMFWPSEINQLQELCRDGDPRGQAFTIDTTPSKAGDGYWSAPDTWVPLS